MGLSAQGLWSQSFSMPLVHLVGHRNKRNGRPTADWNGDVRCTRKRKEGCSAIMTRNNQCGPGWAQQQHVASGEPSIPPMIRLRSRGSTTHVGEQRPAIQLLHGSLLPLSALHGQSPSVCIAPSAAPVTWPFV